MLEVNTEYVLMFRTAPNLPRHLDHPNDAGLAAGSFWKFNGAR